MKVGVYQGSLLTLLIILLEAHLTIVVEEQGMTLNLKAVCLFVRYNLFLCEDLIKVLLVYD